jgi:hypothetical protein
MPSNFRVGACGEMLEDYAGRGPFIVKVLVMRRFCTVLSLLLLVNLCPGQSPFPSQKLTMPKEPITFKQLATVVNEQAGLVVELPSMLKEERFTLKSGSLWEVLDSAAMQSQQRLVPIRKGSAVRFNTSKAQSPAPCYDGPFRFAIRQVTSRQDFDLGQQVTEVALDLHWEPRYPVFRIESEPSLTEMRTDAGQKLNFSPNRTKIPLSGSQHQPVIRLANIPRSAKTVSLSGEYRITASQKLLEVPFKLDKLPQKQLVEGITVILSRAELIDKRVEIQMELEYPKDHPEFESFESFVTQNQAVLRNATQQVWEPSDFEISSQDRRVIAVYRFVSKSGPLVWEPEKWQLNYRTPSPLKEFAIRFAFQDVPLP